MTDLLSRIKSKGLGNSNQTATKGLEEAIKTYDKAIKGKGEPQSVVLGLSAVPLCASEKVQLVVTTAAGLRIYIKTTGVIQPGKRQFQGPTGRFMEPEFALSPPCYPPHQTTLRCQRGGVLSAGDTAVLASALEVGAGGQVGSTELLCVSDLQAPEPPKCFEP